MDCSTTMVVQETWMKFIAEQKSKVLPMLNLENLWKELKQ